jgi:UDP-glucose 4-epimerase
VARIVRTHRIEECIHFAAFAYVGESVSKPGSYFVNNLEQGIALLDALLAEGVRRLVFSSTCAVYGEPEQLPLTESHPQRPANPYGWSKLFMERILETYDQAYGLRFVALRYFNAAGASAHHGEDHSPETHLIPNVLAAARGQLPFVSVYGADYPTRDGSAVRDYIHVNDLSAAHILALRHLRAGGASERINLGNGIGFSVLEVIKAAERLTGRSIEIKSEPRRVGDPAHLVADASKARALLKWQPATPALDSIIGTAWAWHSAHPFGYKDVSPEGDR